VLVGEGKSERPFTAAAWRGEPVLPPNFGSAPLARRYLAASALPKYAERNSGVSPDRKKQDQENSTNSNLPSPSKCSS
jgi:hypothetical protein